jgi:uncharacterized protein
MTAHLASPQLQQALDHAAHYLPAQGPISIFIHHNTLHAFQGQPFDEAVAEAARIFGTEPYLGEATYRTEIANNRILAEDIRFVVDQEPDIQITPKISRRSLRQAILLHGFRPVTAQTVAWSLDEGDWLTQFRKEASTSYAHPQQLWQAIGQRLPKASTYTARPATRPAEAVFHHKGIRLDEVVRPPLIRLTSAYLDQGMAYWPMPVREAGLLKGARQIMSHPLALFPKHLEGSAAVFAAQQERGMTAAEVVLDQLRALGVPEEQWEAFITAELLALPGWAGMVRKLELEPELATHHPLHCSLMEFLALRLTFTTVAMQNICGSPDAWRTASIAAPAGDPRLEQALLFDAAQLTGLDVAEMSDTAFAAFRSEVTAFDDLERRRLLHLAYERRHERRILLPLQQHRQSPICSTTRDRVAAQVIFCIDEREESIRRALEEADPQMETYGAAGFFGCAMDFAGIDDPEGAALCPVVVKPAHEVREVPTEDHAHLHHQRQALRKTWSKLAHLDRVSSQSLVRGWLRSTFLGAFSIVPMLLRILSPQGWIALQDWLNRKLLPAPHTRLNFLREDPEARSAETQLLAGFTTQEKVDRVAAVLGTMGLAKGHARLVCVLGHGSTSENNPHESAHDCGACGGRRGGPNARLFAAMANRPEVRQGLKEKHIFIPEDTWFIGGYHDTCSDEITLSDLDLVPSSHRSDLDRLRSSLDQARAHSAHERNRRFEATPSRINAAHGLSHVEERATQLAEPRPEYGHCTNAVALVGRRQHTRGLFLDRRAFLISYDPDRDTENKALAGTLGAVIPVCGGISLEYYFSSVDNEGYGCGTKLPHNITGLIGVMNGFEGDLRTGLPLQMVEIHEPVRILFVIETTPERLMSVINANPELVQFVKNRWIRLSTMDPEDGHIEVYRAGIFERISGDEEPLPTASSSAAYYQGKMEHLPVVQILSKPAA